MVPNCEKCLKYEWELARNEFKQIVLLIQIFHLDLFQNGFNRFAPNLYNTYFQLLALLLPSV